MAVRKAVRTLAVGLFSLFSARIIGIFLSMITTIFLARFLGPENYGLWGLAGSSIGFFLMAGGIFGIGTAMVKFVSQYNAEEKPDLVRKVTIMGLEIKLLLGLILGIPAFIIAPFIAKNILHLPNLTIIIQILAVNYIVRSLEIVRNTLRGLKKFHIAALFRIFERILTLVLVVAVLLLGFGLMGVAISELATSVILMAALLLVIFLKYVPKSLHSSSGSSEINVLKPMLSFGVPAAIADLISGFYENFLVFYLGIWAGAINVGLFNSATGVYVFILSTSFSLLSEVLFPIVSEMHAKKQIEKLCKLISLISKHVLFLTCCIAIFMWVFAGDLIVIFYSPEFGASTFYLQILLFGAIPGVLALVSYNVILGSGRADLILKLNVLYSIIGTISIFVVVPAFGVTGVCLLKVLLSYFFSLPILIFYAKKFVGNFLAPRAYLMSFPSISICLMLMLFIRSFLLIQLTNQILIFFSLAFIFALCLLVFYVILSLVGGIKKSEVFSLIDVLLSLPMAKMLKPIIFGLKILAKITRS